LPALAPSRLARATFVVMLPLALVLAGCGQGKIEVGQAQHTGAELFNQHCSGCHSLNAANSYGSKAAGQLAGGERTNGPNFNVRKENKDDILFAIRNGGFSGAIMPANVVVGREAQQVADFLAQYSGGVKGKPTDVAAPGQTGSGK
jgi:mono/diheme cytochrome c family protein